MAELLSLPNELLLRIAFHLRYSRRDPAIAATHASLCQLSLTCQRLRPIAQEYLVLDIILERKATYKPPPNGVSPMLLLLRSLLERRDLAKKVESLHINPTLDRYANVEECVKSGGPHGETCGCGWTQIVRLVEDHMRSLDPLGNFKIRESTWWNDLMRGLEDAYFGFILLCTPAVRSITTNLMRSIWKQPYPAVALFGTIAFAKEFQSLLNSCLANLITFTTECQIGPEFFRFPRLETLQFALNNGFGSTLQNQVSNAFGRPPSNYLLSSTLKRLIVIVHYNALYGETDIPSFHVFHYLRIIVKALPGLTHLSFAFEQDENSSRNNTRHRDGNYTHFTSLIQSASLECLTMDISGVHFDFPTAESDNSHPLKYRPMESLVHFPRLRQLLAPQSALFSIDTFFATCALPDTIEHIGIIDSTQASNRYAQFLLENRFRWPKLTEISLWMDIWSSHHVEDPLLISYRESSEMGVREQEQLRAFEVENDIWDEIQAAGIRVTKHIGLKAWRQ